MSEAEIMQAYQSSSKNAAARLEAVNGLRHAIMDAMTFDASDRATYLSVYEGVMRDIGCRYPSLSSEVQRQMAKKRRWIGRLEGEKREKCVRVRA